MVFHPEHSTGRHALDEIQTHSLELGYGWVSGLAASLTTSTAEIESEWTEGSALWDSVTIDVPTGSITHDPGDADDPRWDALAVTDSDGTVQVIKGTPSPVATDDQGNEFLGEQAWTPSPSDQITRDMVVFAIVWIPAGAGNNDDLTNTSDGGVAQPVVDRRMEALGKERQLTREAVITNSGWYRIASVGAVENDVPEQPEDLRASALFSVRDMRQTLHSSNAFWASLFFDNNPTLSLQNSSYYAGDHGAITDIRIVHPDDTYEGGAVEVNVQLQGQAQIPVEYSITHNHIDRGWSPEPWTGGAVPTGWNTTAIDLATHDPIQAVAADGVDDMFAVRRDGSVITNYQQQRNVASIARLSTDLTVGTSGPVRIPWDVVDEGDWDAWDTGDDVFVAPQDGWYSVRVQTRWQAIPDGLRMDVLVDATGNTAQTTRTHSGSATVCSAVGDGQFDLEAGDEIWVAARHDGGSSQTVGGVESETFCYITYQG